ncbi:MAG: hypothetical protein ABJ327_15745 [Litoreibacter sp.]
MPDLDSGHIFLTTFAPIRREVTPRDGGISSTQKISEALAELPTALQSPATINTGINSPFARNKRNHLARMFVLDDTVFNWRVGQNGLIAMLKGTDPKIPQKVDHLTSAYLVFCADIDAVEVDGAPLPETLTEAQHRRIRDSYARELWSTMKPELHEIYSNCYGFENVRTADDFAAYLNKCHVETTMPFHDYYLELPEFNRLPIKPILTAVILPAAVASIALLLRILGLIEIPLLGWNTLGTFVIGILLTIVAAFLGVNYTLKNGEKPLAPAKFDDLPSVLKGLYTQQKFSDFVIDHQGTTAETLHADFGAFLKRHKPDDRNNPTQPPGVISTAMAQEGKV